MTSNLTTLTVTPVAGSSNVAELAWAANALYIKFHDSGWYSYLGVSREQFEALRFADSVGRHFYANIKKAFVARKLTPDEVAALGLSS